MEFRKGFAFLLAALMVLTWSVVADASGFFIPDVGARSAGRGGANVASVDDLLALYINPGGLTRVKGSNLFGNINYDFLHTYYRREPYQSAVHSSNPLDAIQYIVASSDFGLDDFTFAFGVFGPYGVTNRMPKTGPSRYALIEANTTMACYTLGIGWRPIDWFRVGLNFQLVSFKLENYYGFSYLKDRNPKYDLIGKFMASEDFVPNYVLGAIFEPLSWLHIGVEYNPPYYPELKGKLTAKLPAIYGALLGFNYYEDQITVPITYPPIYRAGVRFLYKDVFDVEIAETYIPWSWMKSYPVDLKNETIIADFDLPLFWKDAWTTSLGGAYRIDPHYKVRAGGYYEPSGIPKATRGPGATESNKWGLGCGATISYVGIDFDVTYMHVFLEDYEIKAEDIAYPSTLDDTRGKSKGNYDYILLAVNFGFEKIIKAFKYGGSEPRVPKPLNVDPDLKPGIKIEAPPENPVQPPAEAVAQPPQPAPQDAVPPSPGSQEPTEKDKPEEAPKNQDEGNQPTNTQ